MDDKLDRLREIKIENLVWIIYIGIIILSWYANSKKQNLYYMMMKKRKKSIRIL